MAVETKKYNQFRYYNKLKNMSYIHHETLNSLCENIFISKIGIIKEYDHTKQEGIVHIKEFGELDIRTRNISNMQLHLKEDDKVILLQSSINLFEEEDDNFFDKTYFYILNAIATKTIQKAVIDINNFETKHEKLNIGVKEELSIKAEDKLNINAKECKIKHDSLKINSTSIVVDGDSVVIKSATPLEININGKTLGSIIDDIYDTMASLSTLGQMGTAMLDPASVIKIIEKKATLKSFLK
ncbi:DUF777 family protein [Candidatus Borreliella tachyglossi]|uniref:DUF777 family protein n=1 Tax=Candidatus Borreliella tachyglossi TaxID=1964448 RepID=UPI004041C2D5